MVATVGSISIDLSTNAAKFATGFKSAATTVETQSGRMAKSIASLEKNTALAAGTLKSLGTGLAAGAGLAALASLSGAFDKLKETIGEYDKIASDAKTTGLKTDTFQALAFAAKQANIEYESFNSSLDIFAKNSGLAAKGQGALYSGLKNLNPALLQNILNTKDQEERLKLVADALANTTDATEKAALSTVVFGKGGIEMSRILDQGRASIDKLKKAAQDLGVIIPDDLLQKAGQLDDKLDALSTVINVQLGQALINLAPILVGAIQGFADFSKELNNTAAVIDNFINNPSLANFGKIFGEGSIQNAVNGIATLGTTTHRSAEQINADIQGVQQTLENLRRDAAVGLDVTVQTDRAQEDLKALQDELRRTQTVAEAAANNASGAFDNLLASMGAVNAAAASSNPLPTVHRFGGDPNKITLPSQSFNYQSNVNDSGVGVLKPSVDKTSDNTQTTADNVSKLDTNTKNYIDQLSNDIGGYSRQEQAQQTVAISKLSEVAAWMKLDSYALAALVHNNDSGATGTGATMFGDSFDSQYGSYISSWGVGSIKRPTVDFGSTASDGTSNTSVNVQQPGTTINLTYNAAAGESESTAKQRARDLYDELVLQASRA